MNQLWFQLATEAYIRMQQILQSAEASKIIAQLETCFTMFGYVT